MEITVHTLNTPLKLVSLTPKMVTTCPAAKGLLAAVVAVTSSKGRFPPQLGVGAAAIREIEEIPTVVPVTGFAKATLFLAAVAPRPLSSLCEGQVDGSIPVIQLRRTPLLYMPWS